VIARANGRRMEGPADWQRLRVHLDPPRPLDLEIARARRNARCLAAAAVRARRMGQRSAASGVLIAFRLAQVITLAFAILVGVRRASHPPALIGAWLLASTATLSVVLPMQLATFLG
jgi:hypothetical protein